MSECLTADQVRKWQKWCGPERAVGHESTHILNAELYDLLDELITLRRLAALVRRNEALLAESMDPEIGDGYYSDLIALMENNAIEIVTLTESAGEEVVAT